MPERPVLYRKRIIPDECLLLDRDRVLFQDERIIVTEWDPIHPKKLLRHGFSCFFLTEDIKVSLFQGDNNKTLYWYCDIVDYTRQGNTYVFRDLLADVVLYPDGSVKVMDLDELADAFDRGLVSAEDVSKALRAASKLLDIIYSGKFEKLSAEITGRIPESCVEKGSVVPLD